MMSIRSGLGVALCALAVVSVGVRRADAAPQHDPTGDSFLATAFNLPNSYSDQPVVFGTPTLLGGPSPEGMNWSTGVTEFAGIPGGLATTKANAGMTGTEPGLIAGFASPGTVVELMLETEDLDSYSNNPVGMWGLGFKDLDFGQAVAMQKDSFFGYFVGKDALDQLQPIVIPSPYVASYGLEVGPHPSDPSVSQVIFFKNSFLGMPLGDWKYGFLEDNGDFFALISEISFNGSRDIPSFNLGALIIDHQLGDINGDGFTNGLDVNILGANFGATIDPLQAEFGNIFYQGDANNDGFVNGLDLNIISAHFGESLAAVAAVPEPSTLTLLFGVALWALYRRSRHSRA